MKKITTVAVGFDGSPDAEAAVQWALSFAAQLGAHVVLVHAVGLLEHARKVDLTGVLEATMQRLTSECGVDPAQVRLLVVDGDACSALLRCAQEPLNVCT